MKYQITVKFLAVAAISIGLIMALASIEHKVHERGQYRVQAKSSIANGWSGRQVVVSPILRLTLSRQYEEEVFDKNLEKYVTKQRTLTWNELRVPDQLELKSNIAMQTRYLGIYHIPVYETELELAGAFAKPMAFADNTVLQKAELLTSVSDMRGISNTPSIEWNNENVSFEPSDNTHLLGNYISADITQKSPTQPAEFNFRLRLRGLDSLHFVPAAKQVNAHIESDWPHPYFEGRYLPVKRTISGGGFNAQWAMTEFATSIQQSLANCQNSPAECQHALAGNTFGVGLHDPINIYQKTDRSLKYGFLFIVLTFAVFLLFEVIKRIQIHPVQYTLVGCALAIFYLLLISLSEHLSFAVSYSVSALVCVSLIGFYLRFVLRHSLQALAMSAGMALLYATLYIILKSEDFAFVMGAILTFVSLGLVMIATRNIDWYALSKPKSVKPDGAKSMAQ